MEELKKSLASYRGKLTTKMKLSQAAIEGAKEHPDENIYQLLASRKEDMAKALEKVDEIMQKITFNRECARRLFLRHIALHYI